MKEQKQRYMPMWVTIAVGIFAVLMLLNFVLPFFYGVKHPVFYMKDNALYVINEGKEKGYKIADAAQKDVQITKDGRKIFFQDANAALYQRSLSKYSKNKKIDDDVTWFVHTSDGQTAIYVKNQELWISKGNNKRKIEESVGQVMISNDDKKLIYFKNDVFYVRGLGQNDKPELYTYGEVPFVQDIKSNYKKAFYYENNNLYLKSAGKETELAAKDIVNARIVGKTLYYFRSENGENVFCRYTSKGEEIISTEMSNFYSMYEEGSPQLLLSKNNEIWVLYENKKPFYAMSIPEEIFVPQISDDGKKLYVAMGELGQGFHQLAVYNLKENVIKSSEVIAENVNIVNFTEKKGSVFFWDENNGLQIYKNKKIIQLGKGYFSKYQNDILTYYKQKDDEKDLWVYKKDENKLVDTWVREEAIFGKNLFYIKDNDIYWAKDNENKKIDSDVQAFVFPIGSENNYGDFFSAK